MEQTVTFNDLIRYHYHETSENENQAIEHLLDADFEVKNRLQQIQESTEELGFANHQPRKSTIDAILAYSKHFNKCVNNF